jgi:hypothetical protein
MPVAGEKGVLMKRGLKNFLAVVASLGVVGVAYAIPVGAILSVSDGVTSITLTDNFVGDLNAAIGELTLSTNVGVWSLSISTGITKPVLGSTTNPVMDLVIQASSTGAGSLTYTFSDNNFGPAPGTLTSAISGHVISGAPTTVDYSVYGDGGNTLGTLASLLTTTGTNSLPVLTSNSAPLVLSAPFSLSEVVQLTASGASAVSIDASLNVTPIPEPSTVVTTFLGLTFLVAGLARRRRPLRCAN